jgi:hypothetical protein
VDVSAGGGPGSGVDVFAEGESETAWKAGVGGESSETPKEGTEAVATPTPPASGCPPGGGESEIGLGLGLLSAGFIFKVYNDLLLITIPDKNITNPILARSKVGVKLPATGIPDSVDGMLARVGDGVAEVVGTGDGVGVAVLVGDGDGDGVGDAVGEGEGDGVDVEPEGVDSNPGSPSAAETVNVLVRLRKKP